MILHTWTKLELKQSLEVRNKGHHVKTLFSMQVQKLDRHIKGMRTSVWRIKNFILLTYPKDGVGESSVLLGHRTWDPVLIKSQQIRPILALQDTDQYWQSYEVDAPSK